MGPFHLRLNITAAGGHEKSVDNRQTRWRFMYTILYITYFRILQFPSYIVANMSTNHYYHHPGTHKTSPNIPPSIDFKTLDIIDNCLLEYHIRTALDAYILACHTGSTSLNHPKNPMPHKNPEVLVLQRLHPQFFPSCLVLLQLEVFLFSS